MGNVRNILESKSKEIFSIPPETIVYNALEIMHDKNVSALVVMKRDKLAGIFTERDYARKVILKGRSSKETRIEEIMTEDLITVNQLVGIISIGDVVKNIIDEQKFIIENLEQYIQGR